MEKQNGEKSVDADETSQSQLVDDDDSKVETFDCALKAMEKHNDEKSADAAETSQSQLLDDDDSKVGTFDSVLKAMDKQDEEKSIDVAETSQSQSVDDDDSKVEVFDCVSKAMDKQNEEKTADAAETAETSQSQSVDDDSKADTFDCISKAMEKPNKESSTNAAETSQSQPVDDDSKVETSDSVLKAMEKQNEESSTNAAETSQSQLVVDDDSKIDTFDCISKAKEKQDEEKCTDAAETSQSQSVDDDDSKADTSDFVLQSTEKQNEELSTDVAETSQSQSVDDDLKVETFDCVSKAMENQNEEKTADAAETSQSQSVDDDSKVGTFDCVSKAMEKQNEEKTADAAGTSQSQSVDDNDSKVDTFACLLKSMEKQIEEKSTDAAETSHSQLVDDGSKVETFDFVLKAQGLKEAGNKLFQKRDYYGAMFKYGEAIKILPKDHVEVSHVRANMASCYMQLEPGEFAKAIHECDLALSVTPDYSKALLKRARCYEALNKLDLALKDVCMVSKLDPKNPMASEISDKLKRTLEGKGLTVKDSVIELPPDYVEPVEASPALWAKLRKARVKKPKKSNQVQEKSEGDNVETKQKNNNNLAADKGKEKIIDKQNKKKVKGKQQSEKRSDTSKEQEKVIIEEKLLEISGENVNMAVKFVYSDDIRLAKVPINCTLLQLREVVHERFPGLRAVHIKYKDQEGDLVTITTDEELRMSEVSARSLNTMRFYVVEVSPEQDPFFGRLVEMKKLKISADSFKTKVNGKGGCKVEDWMIEFARLFKIQAGVVSDTCLNLQELGMKLNSEAMEEVVTSDAAQGPFDKAAQQFQEVAARSLLKLGNVHLSGARKRLSLLRGVSGESGSEQLKTAYECVQREHTKAKEKYKEAMKIKSDLFEVFLAVGLQQFEEARLSWYYVLVSQLDLKTWPYSDVVQFYQCAESNIKISMEVLKNLETKPGSSTQDNPENEAGRLKLKSMVDVLLCTILYERSIMEYKLDQPIWRESLEAAMEKFELAGTCRDDVVAIISEDYVAGNTLRDLRFHLEEILHIFNEIDEAEQWRNGISSDQLEDILNRRTANIFHMSNTGIQRG
ncbi:PREDICTED: uncharacterized protein LOC104770416 isoform X2 [Camelina sativa]|uniref:Uncharacterized protein LOC104770416 isoform X1 n=1 Tax=Camelina sativa TaxID=90675 RepID=A0ABM0XZA4_CAMSA|nr:PREDICTED: uncharacterized protein LOC104770416 isoform X1 [Camelina sativa]XP_019097327.1 PREDICTED: uncharacterized protein LOC104770416 isoform X2 [Camelina sativa]